ncbi:MAG: hypothetical protein JST54_13830 [Deltaproteobacteria bacterium]|nr:hypothetical protein [Deltaproteobacteria bacterium]
MRRLAGAVLLLLPLAAWAESGKLFDPPRVDDAPTAFACTAKTLADGEQCVFEGKGGARASAADNAQHLRTLGPQTCAGALKDAEPADAPALQKACLSRFDAAVQRCAAEGTVLDATGHFTADGAACYRSLVEARTQAQSLASAAPSCCACLAQHHCQGSGPSCVAAATGASFAASCGGDACVAACAELVSAAPAEKSPSPRRTK